MTNDKRSTLNEVSYETSGRKNCCSSLKRRNRCFLHRRTIKRRLPDLTI